MLSMDADQSLYGMYTLCIHVCNSLYSSTFDYSEMFSEMLRCLSSSITTDTRSIGIWKAGAEAEAPSHHCIANVHSQALSR